ncbi:hypothetical protein DSECCO2_581160 [anaerobic digester metagenome]
MLHAKGHQPLGQVVHNFRELPVSLPVVAVHVDDRVVVRIFGDGLVQYLAKGPFAHCEFVHAPSTPRDSR